jgi:hypothetical protein
VREQLPWFVGGDVDAATAEAVRGHLRDCAACRREGSALQQPMLALRAAGSPERAPSGAPDEAFFAELQASVMSAVAAGPATRVRPRRTAGLLAAAAALFAVGFWLVPGRARTPLLDRAPLASGKGSPAPAGERRAIPASWSGRNDLQPLSDDRSGAGMLDRLDLRTLEDAGPPRLRVPAPPGSRKTVETLDAAAGAEAAGGSDPGLDRRGRQR